MGSINFRIFKQTDKNILEPLRNIAQELGEEARATVHIRFGDLSKDISAPISSLSSDANIQSIIAAESSIASAIRVDLPALRANVNVVRQPAADETIITLPNDMDPIQAARILTVAHKHLRAYERTESLDKLLGDELAEFYRKREEALLRLEDLNQKLIEETQEYRINVDAELQQHRAKLDAEHSQIIQDYDSKYSQKLQELKAKEEALQAREKELDDRSARHARRQIRQDLKKALERRSEIFTLTKATTHKRWPIHALFILLIALGIGVLVKGLIDQSHPPAGMAQWYLLARPAVTAIALAAIVIFYIRWNDQWFRQHADEEFRLKRLELDIDRASWVVELAMEWQTDKDTELPEGLFDRLTENLFEEGRKTEPVKHPTEDLACALLGASSGLSINVPGFGEVRLDRKGIKRFKKETNVNGSE